ncbi:MAG: twin-arginine translocation signal domain-containing protein, partial [Terriglobales bacterium]
MSDTPDSSRRNFLKKSSVLGVAVVAGKVAEASNTSLPPLPNNPVTEKAMPTRNLGRTGYRVGIFSLGGQASIEQPNNEAVAVPIVERALDLGVNY